MTTSDQSAEERRRFRELCDAPPPRKLDYPCFQQPEEKGDAKEGEKEEGGGLVLEEAEEEGFEDAWLQAALEGLREAAAKDGSVTAEAEVRFRRATALVNGDLAQYNLVVPIVSMQRMPRSETRMAKELDIVRELAADADST